jgi:hypothetical protein
MVLAAIPIQRLSPRKVADCCGVNLSTVNRWMKVGVRGQRLEFACIGRRRYITPEMLACFLARCREAAHGRVPVAPPQRDAAIDAAMSAIESL